MSSPNNIISYTLKCNDDDNEDDIEDPPNIKWTNNNVKLLAEIR